MSRAGLLVGVLVLSLVSACNEFEDPPPASPILPDIPPSQYAVAGRWDGMSDQGRPLRFDVTSQTVVIDGSISIHHDCSGGRLVLQLSGYEAQVRGDSFSATLTWRRDEGTKYYIGTLTVSGRFESGLVARGGFVNSITDKQADNLGVCPPASGSWEASRN